jgi:hypothetical protein
MKQDDVVGFIRVINFRVHKVFEAYGRPITERILQVQQWPISACARHRADTKRLRMSQGPDEVGPTDCVQAGCGNVRHKETTHGGSLQVGAKPVTVVRGDKLLT